MIKLNKTLKAKYLGTLPQGRTPRGIILHDTAGSGGHGDTLYLADPSGDGRKVSVDFTVERDGTIYQLNPDLVKHYTFHAGRNTLFKNLRNQEVTRKCIGIELCQKANLSLVPVWPREQIKAAAVLCAWLCEEFLLKKEDIATHQGIITDGSRSDPRKFPFGEFWAYFIEAAAGSGSEEGLILAEKVFHHVEAGDTLFALAGKYSTTIEKLKALNAMNTPGAAIFVGQTLLVKE